MTDLSITTFFESATKAGVGGAAALILLGLSYVIREWRSGTVSERQQRDLQEQINELSQEMYALKVEISHVRGYGNSMRAQRDNARLVAEREALKTGTVLPPWPSDPAEFIAPPPTPHQRQQ